MTNRFEKSEEGLIILTISDVRASLSEGGFHVIDVNPVPRWKRHHIPGAVNLDPGRFKEDELPKDKQAKLLFYCLETRCSASKTAASRARAMGYEYVAYMPEGIKGWLEAGLPVEGVRE